MSNLVSDSKKEITKRDLFYLMLDNIDSDYTELLDHINKPIKILCFFCLEGSARYVSVLFPKAKFYLGLDEEPDYVFLWGTRFYDYNYKYLKIATDFKKPVFIIEDGFLRSIDTWVDTSIDIKWRRCFSFTINSPVLYFDGTRESQLEKMINDRTLIITEEQKTRARRCIDKVINTNLSKYNHQSNITHKIGREGVKKVLVVDQSYGDMSIVKGLANELTFKNMLQSAVMENPDADIIVKIHPDTIAGEDGYYNELTSHDNIFIIKDLINPIYLIKNCDKVYVCTTQLGFEALMCEKEVNVFGMPFYAGWGLTKDRQICERRTHKRSLEELFYIVYIMFTFYVNPEKEERCEIEDTIDYLLKLRQEYNNNP